jgi:hypothetical protein
MNKTSTLLSQTVKLTDSTYELEDRNEELLEERVNFRTCWIGLMNLWTGVKSYTGRTDELQVLLDRTDELM